MDSGALLRLLQWQFGAVSRQCVKKTHTSLWFLTNWVSNMLVFLLKMAQGNTIEVSHMHNSSQSN